MELTARARRYIERMDPAIAGSGGHDRTFAVAATLLHGFAFDRGTALALLTEWNTTHCQPPWSDRELIHKIDSAMGRPSEKPLGYLIGKTCPRAEHLHHAPAMKTAPAWPVRDHERILTLLTDSFTSLSDLEALSPVPPAGLTDPYAIIDHLFLSGGPPDPWLCFAGSPTTPATRRRSEWQGHLDRARFVVPSPMTGPKGKTQDGRDSVRCLGNTCPRRFLVIESDFTESGDGPLFAHLRETGGTVPDLCATVLRHLAEYAPLVMAVHSGGKSLHGWFAVLNQSESDLKRFMRWACLYGADKATWTRCQLVRMPCGTRDDGRPQSVHFFNPDPDLFRP
jgi:hypothetical protein